MDLIKSQWMTGDDKISFAVPIEKVDRKNRLVSGWATLDNIDTSDDVVVAEASARAFERFAGNIREMHQPIAVGSLREFKQESFYDTVTKAFYNGIFVTVYVSEGAEDTWKKVLDGTLKGFSIGGNIIDQSTEFSKDAGKSIRFIKEYDLVELSLVDSPANQLGHITAVVKFKDGVMKGLASETTILNTFWCGEHEIVKNSDEGSVDCPVCNTGMQEIGFVEATGDIAEKTATVVDNFLRKREDDAIEKKAETTAHSEGGVEMTEKIEKNADEAEEVAAEGVAADAGEEVGADAPGEVTPEDEQGVAVAAEGNENAAVEGVEEVASEPDFEKLLDDFKDNLKESIEKTVEAVEKKVQEATQAFDEKASELEKSLGELGEKLEGIKTEREGVAKRLDALEKSSAIKKSGEVETEPVTKAKEGFWSGTILTEE